jgi:outer membrane protein assembly factor BamA
LVSGLQSTELSFEPLPLFGETDTQARYTLAQHLSPNTTFIASRNPREAEAQTYILDLHNFYFAPSLRAQIFTNDQKNEGLTLQQTVRFGGRRRSEAGPRVRSRRVDVPEGVSRRKVRRALGYRKGDSFPPGAVLDVEVDVAEAMRRFGYPDSTVDVSTEPASKRRVDLRVVVDSGPQVDFVYEGEKLSRSLRRAIADEYRSDDESTSLQSVRDETVRVLRGLGFLSPQVDVTVEAAGVEKPRTVRVATQGGRRADPGPPIFSGVAEEDAEHLAKQFVSRLGRVELAAGEPAADRHLVDSLRNLGYPDPEIAARELSEDGKRLSVRLEPGQRLQIASLDFVGVAADTSARLRELIEIDVGDPAGAVSITRAAHAIEDDFRKRGYAEARVRALAQPLSLDRPFDMTLRFEVEPGPTHRIGSIRYEGLKASRPGWVEGIADIDEGGEYSRHKIAEARGRLYRTGVFQRIRVSSDQRQADREGEVNGRVEDVSTPNPSDPLITDVTFQLEEAPRFQVSYGIRWENGRDIGIVVDALDRHSLGRGHTSGVRVVYGDDKKSFRLYHLIPRVVGPRGNLELFIESKEEVIENITDEGVESWVQLTFPLTERVQNRLYTVFQTRELTAAMPDPDEPLDDRVISPRLGWQVAYDTQSRTVGQPRRKGLFLGMDLSGSHKDLGSDLTVLALFNQIKLFVPIGKRESGRFTWSQSWRTGLVDGFGDEIPVVDRLRAGGEFSVRGYPTDSLGPQDAEGNALGGEFLFVVNQELHSRIWGSVSGLAFFDAGNVWETREEAELDLFKSVGLGARYLSPVGPLRLDVAWPLDQRPDDPEYKVYFGFGNVF